MTSLGEQFAQRATMPYPPGMNPEDSAAYRMRERARARRRRYKIAFVALVYAFACIVGYVLSNDAYKTLFGVALGFPIGLALAAVLVVWIGE